MIIGRRDYVKTSLQESAETLRAHRYEVSPVRFSLFLRQGALVEIKNFFRHVR